MFDRIRGPLVCGFVIFHCLFLIISCGDRRERIMSKVAWLRPFYSYNLLFFQFPYSLFAPDPGNENVWFESHFDFSDGSTEVVRFPKAQEMPFLKAAVFGQRYDKIFSAKFMQKRRKKKIRRLMGSLKTWSLRELKQRYPDKLIVGHRSFLVKCAIPSPIAAFRSQNIYFETLCHNRPEVLREEL